MIALSIMTLSINQQNDIQRGNKHNVNVNQHNDTYTLSIITLSIMTLNIMTLNIMTLSISIGCH